MRTYSLYLSTSTGQQQITANVPSSIGFNATITGTTLSLTSSITSSIPTGIFFMTGGTINWITGGSGTSIGSVYTIGLSSSFTTATLFISILSLNVTSTTSPITLNQSLNMNGVSYVVEILGSASGGPGYYYLGPNPPMNLTFQTYSINSTGSSNLKYSPSNKSNLSQVKWNINWREIFGTRNGECRVRAKLISQSSSTISWINNVGSLRCTLSSNTSNSTNGFNIGCVLPKSDVANVSYLECDTTGGDGSTMLIPNSNGDFTISLLNGMENLMINSQEYQIWLYFDVDE